MPKSTQTFGSMGSSRTGSVRSFDLLQKKETISCSMDEWTSLQATAREVRRKEEELVQQKALVDENGSLSSAVQCYYLASEIHDMTVSNKIRRKQIEELRRKCAKKRQLTAILIEEKKNEESKQVELIKKISDIEDRIRPRLENQEAARKRLRVFFELCTERRRHLLEQAFGLFRIEINASKENHPSTSKNCRCSSYDCILGIHLPHFTNIPGHTDVELSTALGYTAQLVECIAKILDYPLRYPMIQHGSSTTKIYLPKEEKVINLHMTGNRWRADKDRLDQAVTLLGRNVAQLRTDSGFHSPGLEKTLQALHHWAGAVFREAVKPTFDRPYMHLSSPASVMLRVDDDDEARSLNLLRDVPSRIENSDENDDDSTIHEERQLDSTDSPVYSVGGLDTSAVSALGSQTADKSAEQSEEEKENEGESDDDESVNLEKLKLNSSKELDREGDEVLEEVLPLEKIRHLENDERKENRNGINSKENGSGDH